MILLLPTDFRQKPLKFSKWFSDYGCTFDEFKVEGVHSITNLTENKGSLIKNENISHADLHIKIHANEKSLELKNVKLQSISNSKHHYDLSLLKYIDTPVTAKARVEFDLNQFANEKSLNLLLETSNQHW